MKECSLFSPLFLLLFCCLNKSHAQDTSFFNTYKLDTLQLTPKKFTKTVVYNYRSVIFYLDYYSFKQAVVKILKGYRPYKKEVYEATLTKLKKEIRKSDSVFITQETYDSAQVIPFDIFLITQIMQDKCIIKDKENRIQTFIIRMKGIKHYHPGIWGGQLFYFPGDKKYFIRTTDIVS